MQNSNHAILAFSSDAEIHATSSAAYQLELNQTLRRLMNEGRTKNERAPHKISASKMSFLLEMSLYLLGKLTSSSFQLGRQRVTGD